MSQQDTVITYGGPKRTRGATADRPVGVAAGFTFYDETLDKELVWDGAVWRDPQGYNAALARSGATAARPAGAPVGFMYYDTTLTLPVFWDGVGWRNAAGVAA
jgi:hypothetical protein